MYEKIEVAVQNQDKAAVYYWYGRLANLMIDFQPIALDDDLQDPTVLLFNPMLQQEEEPGSLFDNMKDFSLGYLNASIGTTSPSS